MTCENPTRIMEAHWSIGGGCMSGKRVRLARQRRAMGMTQEQLAASIGMGTDRSTIYRWESGEITPPPRKQPRLARALDVSPTELIDLLMPEAEAGEPLSIGRVGHALRSPSSTDSATVESLWQEVRGLDERYDRMPSTSLLADTGQALGQIGFLGRNGGDGALQRDLFAAEATAATLMGQLVWDASQRRDHRTARQYFDQAAAAAREIGSPAAEGHALLRTSYLALYGERDPVEGLRLTERTAEVTRLASNVLTGLAQLHSAEAHAMLGDRRRCESALAAAECSFSSVRATDGAAHLFSETQFDRLAGSCYLFLGDHRRAERILDTAAQAMTAQSKSRAIVLGNLSLAHLRRRDLDAAAASLHDAIDVLEATRGGGGLNIVSDAVRKLRRWRGELVVQDIYDRVFSLMTTS